MNRIASFTVDHNRLERGMYISRIDGDVVTYDIRFVKPNTPPYLDTAAAHTIEHLMATFVRNSVYSDAIVYVGPMGCRTGFYLLTRDTVSHAQAMELTRDALAFIAAFEGDIPGNLPEECGNYREHNLPLARKIAADMLRVLTSWSEEQMVYRYHLEG